jgi:hypothetical protein
MDLWTLGVMVDFIKLAEKDEAKARDWFTRAACFKTNPSAPLLDMVNEAAQRQASLEPRILSQLIWLKTDAVTFFPRSWSTRKRLARCLHLFVGLSTAFTVSSGSTRPLPTADCPFRASVACQVRGGVWDSGPGA